LLKELSCVRTSFCKNLHAKCYLNEEASIVTSLNLYEFSMVNNNEMGVLIARSLDTDLYRDAYDEALRIIRISEEVRISLERVEPTPDVNKGLPAAAPSTSHVVDDGYDKLTTAKLAAKMGLSTKQLLDRLTAAGLLALKGDRHYVTLSGKGLGGEWRPGAGGGYQL
jgi:hypothetical protein